MIQVSRIRRVRCCLWAAACGALAVAGCGAAASDRVADAAASDRVTGADECVEETSRPGPGQLPTSYTRKTWDASSRILSAESSSTPSFTGNVYLAWRYHADGRVIAYAGFAHAGDMFASFQQDYLYDDRGNVIDSRLSYPGQPDLLVRSTADTWMGTMYESAYDDQRLATSAVTPYGPGSTSLKPSRMVFHEDANDRCERIETNATDGTPQRIETRMYDDAGRVVRVDRRSFGAMAGLRCADRIDVNSYDADGRLTEVRSWCGTEVSGDPDVISTTSYEADGAQRLEYSDFSINDTPNDVLTRPDGTQVPFTHHVIKRTPGCATIDAAIGAPMGARCRLR